MNRGDRREAIFKDDPDWERFPAALRREGVVKGSVAANVKSPVRDERSLRTATTCGRPPIFLPSLAGLLPLMDA